MVVTVDDRSGFCFGVTNAIGKAEEILDTENQLLCLGEIVHNDVEVNRLTTKGLTTINHEDLKGLSNRKVLFRAHGEPPSTYEIAKANGLEVIDASCPVVLKLQQRIKKSYMELLPVNGQIVIFGKKGHAEVNGLVGQTDNTAIVVEGINDLDAIDFSRPIRLYSQTTKSIEGFKALKSEIEKRINAKVGEVEPFEAYDTICRQVANRQPQLMEFARNNDVIIFVSGKKSSNGKVLFETCLSQNKRTFMVEDEGEIETSWFEGVNSVGVCGATSTPRWLMERVAQYIRDIIRA
ncbi:4-hydroxy-3-methylbut-2-enyl diphosphate reductase [Acetobacteroides hydrogenigenes]|uniref:4-hydroxy-3-methylbut-2-enyl diphosphate reductase n=1 Tax=Acetobacteroides hydrogenigenes TaxID=979970 RepID=A0A4R2E3A9_9BACT|nr:4-hydroxy-3-methylbut-2-enyl diphosphate reductase [Acetobacteroides hydrogenigenes]TCN62051.1 4-hydroxy-3-methylbut-2-enyl diphosphate reductase [Acetobacteroides hydrogenigenes]